MTLQWVRLKNEHQWTSAKKMGMWIDFLLQKNEASIIVLDRETGEKSSAAVNVREDKGDNTFGDGIFSKMLSHLTNASEIIIAWLS